MIEKKLKVSVISRSNLTIYEIDTVLGGVKSE